MRSLKGHLLVMASKETPKKVYRAPVSSRQYIDTASCGLCRSVGDRSHRKDIFRPTNKALLKIAEQLCGHSIAPDPSLPRQVCRPCERRLKNSLEFQKFIVETQNAFQQSEPARVKRCIDVSPSIARPPKSRLTKTVSARTSLTQTFAACEEVSCSPNAEVEVCIMKYSFCSRK